MSTNFTIQIKRGEGPPPEGSLSPFELAYDKLNEVLHIGTNTTDTGTKEIGGEGAFITKNTNQTIPGSKTFTGTVDFSPDTDSEVKFNGTDITNNLTKLKNNQYVDLTTTQTITGSKQFSNKVTFSGGTPVTIGTTDISSANFLKLNRTGLTQDGEVEASKVLVVTNDKKINFDSNKGNIDFQTGSITGSFALNTTGSVTFEDVLVNGNLTVRGNQTILNTSTVRVEDHQIELGFTTDATDITADDGGILLHGTTDKKFTWSNSTDSWTSTEHINLGSGKNYRLGGVVYLSEDGLGDLLFKGDSLNSPQDTDRLLIYREGSFSKHITWGNLKSSLESQISGIDVDITMPSAIFNVSKISETDGTLFNITFDNQNPHVVFAGPTGETAGQPSFRALVEADIPSLAASKITSGTLAAARGGTGVSNTGTITVSGNTTIGSSTHTVGLVTTANTSVTLPTTGTLAVDNQTMHIGTTSVAINRASSALALTGISSIALPIAGATITIQPAAGVTSGTHTISFPGTTGNVVTTGDTATITNAMLSGSIANNKLANSGVTINGSSVSLGGSVNLNLDSLSDVVITSPEVGSLLMYNGTQGWIDSNTIDCGLYQ